MQLTRVQPPPVTHGCWRHGFQVVHCWREETRRGNPTPCSAVYVPHTMPTTKRPTCLCGLVCFLEGWIEALALHRVFQLTFLQHDHILCVCVHACLSVSVWVTLCSARENSSLPRSVAFLLSCQSGREVLMAADAPWLSQNLLWVTLNSFSSFSLLSFFPALICSPSLSLSLSALSL